MLIGGKKRNLQRRKFCLTCSPFGRHNTSPFVGQKRHCLDCGTSLTSANTYRKSSAKTKLFERCKKCLNHATLLRLRGYKAKAAYLLGGKCQVCGYAYCLAALHFHHREPDTKIDTISNLMRTSWAAAEKELFKTTLLCSNCHAECHYLGPKTDPKRNDHKTRALKMLGNRCSKCNYDKCADALHFHHESDDRNWSRFSNRWHCQWENIERELKLCVLLCGNCHMEEHYPDMSNWHSLAAERPTG